METQQFPPSSPLINDDHEDGIHQRYMKPSINNISHVVDELPTPNPSSSIGDVTNQQIQVEEVTKQSPLEDQLETYESTFENVLEIPISGEEIRIGRSGLVSNYTLNSKNKAISRLHLKVKYLPNENLVEIHCIGYNGINVTIPVLTDVHDLKDHKFLISIKGGVSNGYPLDNSRVLDRNKDFTNFYMLRYETVKIPLIKGTILDIRGEVILLKYPKEKQMDIEAIKDSQIGLDEEIDDANKTMDDIQVDQQVFPPMPIERECMVNSFVYKESTPDGSFIHSTPISTPLADKTFVQEEVEPAKSPVKSPVKLPVKSPLTIVPVSIAAPVSVPIPVSKSVSVPKPKSAAAAAALKSVSTETPPLKDITNIKKHQQQHAPTGHKETKRGRPSKKQKTLTEEDEIREMSQGEIDKVLNGVESLEDLSNVIINYIAYSRILQTPFQLIRDLASVKKKNLSKFQLRCILIHSIGCIGVIFREGKDAAGKPLDEEYYYIPERDDDASRVKLVEDLKGSSSNLRSCRKTHKQYFWKKPK